MAAEVRSTCFQLRKDVPSMPLAKTKHTAPCHFFRVICFPCFKFDWLLNEDTNPALHGGVSIAPGNGAVCKTKIKAMFSSWKGVEADSHFK